MYCLIVLPFFLQYLEVTNMAKQTLIIPCISKLLNAIWIHNVGSEVFTVMAMKSSVFWDIRPYIPLKVGRRFGGTCRRLLAWLILLPWKWRRHTTPNHPLPFSRLHGVISQKIKLLKSYYCGILVFISLYMQRYNLSEKQYTCHSDSWNKHADDANNEISLSDAVRSARWR
jgi:hypothetical protein